MRKLAVIFVLLACSQAWASIAYVSGSHAACATSTTATNSLACALGATTTGGNTVIIGLQWKTLTRNDNFATGATCNNSPIAYAGGTGYTVGQCAISGGILWVASQSTTGHTPGWASAYWNAPSAIFLRYAANKVGIATSSNSAVALLVCPACAAITHVVPTFSGTTTYTIEVEEYSGVVALGKTALTNATSGTNPGFTTSTGIATGDADNWVVVATSNTSDKGVPTADAGHGNLRDATRVSTTSSYEGGSVCDNTAASAGTIVECLVTITTGYWNAVAVELRSTAPPKTYIWPDCDSTHPCMIYHQSGGGTSLQAVDTITTPVYMWVDPSLANNLLVWVATYPSAKTLTFSENTSSTWATGPTTTDTAKGIRTDIKYLCGNPGNVNLLQFSLDSTLAASDMARFDYFEFSGVATSACSDASNSANTISPLSTNYGAVAVGSYNTNVDGDLVFTYALDAGAAEFKTSGWAQPDDLSALIWANPFDAYMYMMSVQGTHGATNPAFYVSSQDINYQDVNFNVLSQAFKAASAGTQPPAGRAWVVRDIQYYVYGGNTINWFPFPTTGNAFVIQTTNNQTGQSMVGLRDNAGGTYTVNPINDAGGNPQQYTYCMGTASSKPDKSIIWFTGNTNNMPVNALDIAGAKNSSGTGCRGSKVTLAAPGTQGTPGATGTTNANIVGDVTITPTLNSTAYSVVVTSSYLGTGPVSAPCISGGIGPTCTGDMSNFVLTSIWASGISDGGHWINGDPYGFWYTNSTSSYSVDYKMANGTAGTGYEGSAVEIMGEPAAATTVRKRVTVIQQ